MTRALVRPAYAAERRFHAEAGAEQRVRRQRRFQQDADIPVILLHVGHVERRGLPDGGYLPHRRAGQPPERFQRRPEIPAAVAEIRAEAEHRAAHARHLVISTET